MPSKNALSNWFQNALNASDMMQGYVDVVVDKIEALREDGGLDELKKLVEKHEPTGCEEAAAKAMILWLIDNP